MSIPTHYPENQTSRDHYPQKLPWAYAQRPSGYGFNHMKPSMPCADHQKAYAWYTDGLPQASSIPLVWEDAPDLQYSFDTTQDKPLYPPISGPSSVAHQRLYHSQEQDKHRYARRCAIGLRLPHIAPHEV